MKTSSLGALILLLAFSSFACINTTGTKYNGGTTVGSGLLGVHLLQTTLNRSTQPDGLAMEAELRGATNFNDRSDYTVALIYLGRNQEAIALLESLEQEKPGEFFVAGNLGTAYELNGNNEAALHWIKEEIKRDPEAHDGTEWLHAKILEAKIARQKDPDYFKKHSVLELQPDKINGMIMIDGKEQTPRTVTDAIQVQLAERLKFVKPPDAPVASLLFDYAAIEAATKSLESAKAVLTLALQYGYPPDKVEPLLKFYDKQIAWRKTKQYSTYAIIGIAFLALLFSLYKRGIFVLSRKDLKRKQAN